MGTLSPPGSPPYLRPERPGAVSAMSYASNKSHKSQKSSGSKFKFDLTENSADKRRLEGKADPTKALREAQPAAVALEDSNLENLRNIAHKDKDGNVIIDPDRSNPTRPRMERPLDTIRSFNAAAEGTTSRRHSYQRPVSQVGHDGPTRRSSSYYGAPNNPYPANGRAPPIRPGQGGYYKNHSYGYRPESFIEEGPQQYQPGPPPPRHLRMPTNQYGGHQELPNSIHSHQPSYETMTSGSDEMSKSTNPSSQNSSFDQLHQMATKKPDEYQNNPYRQGGPVSNGMRNPYPPSAMNNVRPNGQVNVYTNGHANRQPNGQMQGYQTDDYGFDFGDRPIPPPKVPSNGPLRHNFNTPAEYSARPARPIINTKPEKRQSWIKRTFSKKN